EFIRLGIVKEKTLSIGLIDSFHACHSYWLKIALQMRGHSVRGNETPPNESSGSLACGTRWTWQLLAAQ
ncbi:hypothetical protein ACOTDO_32895, partial [Achromobacter xylosoxidans]